MSQRYLPSIFPECDKSKQVTLIAIFFNKLGFKAYDKCFTAFFQNYLNSDTGYRVHRNPCEELFAVYQDCVEKVGLLLVGIISLSVQKLEKDRPYEIDLAEIRKEVLNQGADCFANKK
jgi:hypothetical protein